MVTGENIPILGWFLVGGKCRHCGEPISFRYPLVEFLTAAFCVGAYWYLAVWQGRPASVFVAWTGLALAILAAGIIDLKFYIIPDAITKTGMVLAPVVSVLVPGMYVWSAKMEVTWTEAFLQSVIGMAAGAGFVYLVGVLGKLVFGREAMGFGDVKFVGMIGGFLGWPAIIWTFIIGSILGLVFVIVGAVKTERGALPFAPSLGLGAIAFMIWQQPLVQLLFQFGDSAGWALFSTD
jgi:leader peptidase (prepilin peptidase)/N-methyltransferase